MNETIGSIAKRMDLLECSYVENILNVKNTFKCSDDTIRHLMQAVACNKKSTEKMLVDIEEIFSKIGERLDDCEKLGLIFESVVRRIEKLEEKIK